ncbi:MAG: 3-hydroxyacyl-ACP dehydratase FabZ [Eubacteriales bacterium]|nr:beta-hydroxyacyl-ACP dehydratase [Sarcina sp.]MBR2728883.1 3-hydroxyacyl-ACP dehydratase FabZ [Lachnospiraceae bacterium]MDO4416860.1 3-hydroxyacyl-ACP dehydratase FabZ [Eubacteriales bacterium]
MKREQIRQLLPHREPMLLLDELELHGGAAVGRYQVRGDEFFLQGHFPGNPIVPGVILCEMLAQTACVLVDQEEAKGRVPVYTGIDQVRFRAPVRPGDRIETSCRIVREKRPFYFINGSVYVGGKACVTASFSFALARQEAQEEA